jgi:hypothetical protein
MGFGIIGFWKSMDLEINNLEVPSMSSPEELTFVLGRWLRPIIAMLDLVRLIRGAPTSSREQVSTAPNR